MKVKKKITEEADDNIKSSSPSNSANRVKHRKRRIVLKKVKGDAVRGGSRKSVSHMSVTRMILDAEELHEKVVQNRL